MKKMNQWLLVGLVVFLTGCEKPSSEGVADVSDSTSTVELILPADASAMLKANAEVRVLDIRTPEEFSEGHIEGAINVDFKSEGFDAEITKLDKATPYIVHCASGGRSGKSLSKFESMDFQKIYHLEAGFSGWAAEDLPVSQ